jgi:hypothetical protein
MSTELRLFSFIVEVPSDPNEWDFNAIRDQVGDGRAELFNDEKFDVETRDKMDDITNRLRNNFKELGYVELPDGKWVPGE